MKETPMDIVTTLIFDSWVDPGPELRAVHSSERHLIYEGGGVILDLLLRNGEGGGLLHVGGQVLPGGPTLESVSDLEVRVEHGSSHSTTRTNALGEFAFQVPGAADFDLAVTLQNQRFAVRGLSSPKPRMWTIVPSCMGGE